MRQTMWQRIISWAWVAALVAVLACGDEGADGADPPVRFVEQQHEWPYQVSLELDLLFVVDTSSSMADDAAAIATAARDMGDMLDTLPRCKASMHIGVVSADLGAGPYEVLGCSGEGDGAVLQNAPRSDGCSAPSDRFIRDVILEDGTRETNYDGSLADALACVLPLGADGCEMPQSLEAMRRALDGSVAANDGFLRPRSFRMVAFVSDGDDCSAADVALFDPGDTSVDDPLGPLSEHRCFDFGVQCTPDTPREVGAKADCAPREDSAYVHPVADYVEFLEQLAAPARPVVSSALGPPTPVVVERDASDAPALAASCDQGGRTATPATRLGAFTASFQNGLTTSMCSDSLAELVLPVVESLAVVLAARCLQGDLIDIDAQRAGVQPECAVTETYYPFDAPAVETVLPPCDDPDDPASSTVTPCFYTVAEPLECADTPTQLTLEVYPDRDCIPGARSLSIRCAAR